MLGPMLKIGHDTVIGERYRIDRLLGRGGMGAVYSGVELATGAKVAVKVLETVLQGDDEVLLRFKREATASTAVNHDGVVKVLASGTDEGTPFLVMELLEGETLAERLARFGPFPVEQAVAALAAVLEVLDVAHREGVVHRDLKPANVFLARQPKQAVKVLDFGISRLGHAITRITRAGAMMGTLPYMAPEQVKDSANANESSDLYAVGVMAFELLSGRLPLEAKTQLAFMQKIVGEPAPPLSSVASSVPPKLAELVDALLRKHPGERPASARAVRQAMLEVASPDPQGLFRDPVPRAVILSGGDADTGGFGATRPRAAPTREAPPPPPAAPTAAAPTAAAPRPSPRWPWAVALAGLVAAIGAVASAGLAAHRQTPAAAASAPPGSIEAKPKPAPAPEWSFLPGSEILTENQTECGRLCSQAEEALAAQPQLAAYRLNRCLLKDPFYSPAWFLWARLLERIGLGQGRARYYRHFLALAPEDHPRRADALAALETAMEPRAPDAATTAWFDKARSPLTVREILADLRRCVDADPEYAPCWYLLGQLSPDGSLEERQADLIALHLDPDSVDAYPARERLDRSYWAAVPHGPAEDSFQLPNLRVKQRELAPGPTRGTLEKTPPPAPAGSTTLQAGH